MMKAKPATRRYLRIDDVVYQSEAFRTLPGGAMKLYIDLRVQLNGYNNGNVNATLSTLAKRGWTSPDTLHRALKQLLARGLIDRTRHGKPGPGRVCSLFRFTDVATPKNEDKFIEGRLATLDFTKWERKFCATETVATLLRKSKRCRYGIRSVGSLTDTETVAQKNDENGRKAAPVLASKRIGR